MMTHHSKETPESQWEVSAHDHGAEVIEYFDDVDSVLDFCGRVLYTNGIFTVTLVRISYAGSEGSWEGWASPDLCGRKYAWIMKCIRRGKIQPFRFFDHRHDLFGMVIAELKQGTDHIEISKDH